MNDYWKNLDGFEYDRMFEGKYEGDHAAQIGYLLPHVLLRRVVEFGAGSGQA